MTALTAMVASREARAAAASMLWTEYGTASRRMYRWAMGSCKGKGCGLICDKGAERWRVGKMQRIYTTI